MKRVLFISGPQGAGKSTVARRIAHLVKDEKYIPVLMKFADPLYDLHHAIYAKLQEYGVPIPKKPDRALLQLLGTQWGRRAMSEDFWVNIMRPRIDRALDIKNTIVIVDDVRFHNELFMPISLEVCRVRLNASKEARRNRAEKWGDESHESETTLDQETRFHLIYDTTNAYLEDVAVKIWNWMKKN